jgi:hypothetical protein
MAIKPMSKESKYSGENGKTGWGKYRYFGERKKRNTTV